MGLFLIKHMLANARRQRQSVWVQTTGGESPNLRQTPKTNSPFLFQYSGA